MTNPTFQVQFPIVPGAGTQLAVPPKPAGQADSYMVQVAQSPQSRQALVCKSLLPPPDLARAEQLAKQLYPQMLNNTAVFMEFGKDAVARMNALIDQLLKQVEPVDIPELTGIMRNLNDEMRKVKGKYDISDSRTRERIEKWIHGERGLFSFFGNARSLIEALMEDAMSIEQQLDRVKGALGGKSQQLLRNVGFYDQLYTTNEQEITNVIGTIAVMELIHDLAQQEASEIVVDTNDPGERQKTERKRLPAEFANNMQIRITEYKNRLFIGWTTSPQVTNMRTLDVGLAQKLDLLLNLTIPVMKGTILQWRLMIQTQQAADMDRVVSESANEWLLAYSQAGSQVVPMIAEQVQTPSLTPQTIAAMADAVSQQADGLVAAYEHGKERRAAVDDSLVRAQRIIQNATERVSDAIVNQIVDNATRPLDASVLPPQ